MITNPQFKPGVLEGRVDRARQSIRPCTYKLGRGGFNPGKPLDATWDGGRSDCTGFISHVLMTRRAPKPGRDFWIETTAIYRDAVTHAKVFERIDRPVPGCMVVYPDRNGSEGHIGIVETVHDSLANPSGNPIGTRFISYTTIECASGVLGKLMKKAIRRRPNAQNLFGKKGAIFVCLKQDLI